MKKVTSTVTRFDLENITSGQYALEIQNKSAALSTKAEKIPPHDKLEKNKVLYWIQLIRHLVWKSALRNTDGYNKTR